MYSKLMNQDQLLALRLERGEEIVESIRSAAADYNIRSGIVSGIGAVSEITLFLFQTSTKQFVQNKFSGDLEILGINGNLTTKDGACYPHLHIAVANASAQTFGGHLVEAKVSATAEIFIQILSEEIPRAFSDEIGIYLMSL